MISGKSIQSPSFARKCKIFATTERTLSRKTLEFINMGDQAANESSWMLIVLNH